MTLRQRLASALILAAVAAGCSVFESRQRCEVCTRPIHGQVLYRISLQDGTRKDVCCPRCGIHFQSGRTDVAGVEVADFNSGALVDAQKAHFVESSEVVFCCLVDKVQRDRSGAQYVLDWDRCMPSLVAFASLEEAEAFREQKGGVLKTYAQLLEEEDFSGAPRAKSPYIRGAADRRPLQDH